MNNLFCCFGCFFILILIIILFIKHPITSNKEPYGGPVKNIKRIPKNNCYNLCREYYIDCFRRFGHNDFGDCVNSYNNCISNCNYTSFHRV